jgi:hypothetical protein
MGAFNASLSNYFGARDQTAQSNTTFGSILSTIFSLSSLYLSVTNRELNPIPLMIGALLLLFVIWSPSALTPLYVAWSNLWKSCIKVVIFFVWIFYILPAGLLLQFSGKDPLNLRFQPKARTYWQRPQPTGSMQDSA